MKGKEAARRMPIGPAHHHPRLRAWLALAIAAALILLALLPALAWATPDVVISQLKTRGTGGTSDEFVELYNPSYSPVDISGWTLRTELDQPQGSGSVVTRAIVPASTVLGSRCHYLIAGTGYTGPPSPDLTLASGITDAVGIGLESPGPVVVDAVATTPNTIFGQGAPLSALTTDTDQSYERKPGGAAGNGTYTGDSSSDFTLDAPSVPRSTASACVNQPPVFGEIGGRVITVGDSLDFTVNATDADGDALTYAVTNAPSGSTFNTSTGEFSWTPGAGDVGTYPNVHFSVDDGHGGGDSEDMTITVNALPANTIKPKITGIPKPGATLSCSNGTWSGSPTPTYTRQWLRNGAPIAGKTTSTYVAVAGDVGKQIACRVTASNAVGSRNATSTAVTIQRPPANTTRPKIIGTAKVGKALSCSNGTWAGSTPLTYTRRWLRDGKAITGATLASYTARAADRSHSLSCMVTAKNKAGTASATSVAVKVTREEFGTVMPSTAPAKDQAAAKAREFSGPIILVNRPHRRFALSTAHRRVRIKALSSTRYDGLRGFGSLHKGTGVEVKAKRSRRHWSARRVALVPGGGWRVDGGCVIAPYTICPGADLHGVDLHGANLAAAHLEGADLSAANLSGAEVPAAYLEGANLTSANFTGANLYETYLERANLHGANLHGAQLYRADLENARAEGANLSNAMAMDADLDHSNLHGANLFRAELTRARAQDADLSGADLTRAELSWADLFGADLSGANVSDAIFCHTITPDGSVSNSGCDERH